MNSNEFELLISQINQATTEKQPVIVAISGFGGAGKSTLANTLRDYFNLNDKQLIRIDNLYGPNPDGPGIFDQANWPLVRELLDKVRAGERLYYTGKDYRGNALAFDEDLPAVVIIEGIRLLQPELMPYFDISIWIDCPQPFALERAKQRDREQGQDEATVLLWDSDWGPKDKAYFERYQPLQLASFIYPKSA